MKEFVRSPKQSDGSFLKFDITNFAYVNHGIPRIVHPPEDYSPWIPADPIQTFYKVKVIKTTGGEQKASRQQT